MNGDAPPVIVYAPDLLLRQQLVEHLKAAGVAARGAATRARFDAALAEGASAVVLELDGVGVDGAAVVTELNARGMPVLGFCAHTKAALIKDARAAGADKVVARGEVTLRAAKLVRALVGTGGADA